MADLLTQEAAKMSQDRHDLLAQEIHEALHASPPRQLPSLALLSSLGSAEKVARAALRRAKLWGMEDALQVVGALLAKQNPGPHLAAVREAAGASGASGVCGTVWRKDELAYKCKTCERDPTCAICVSCFRHGNHEGHDYAMIRTGGGCCDCGDVQAWKSTGFCDRHNGAISESDDPAVGMPVDVRRNVAEVSMVVADQARALSILLARCMQNKKRKYLSVATITVHTMTVCTLLKWIGDLVECGDGVRRVVAIRLVKGGKASWVAAMLRVDGFDRLPRQLQSSLHALYYQLITDLVFKREFLELFVQNYENFIIAQVNKKTLDKSHPDYYDGIPSSSLSSASMSSRGDDDSDDPRSDILDSFSVQLFTVPALIPVMIRDNGLLDVLVRSLLHLFETASTPLVHYRNVPRNMNTVSSRQAHSDEAISDARGNEPDYRPSNCDISFTQVDSNDLDRSLASFRSHTRLSNAIENFTFRGYGLHDMPRDILQLLVHHAPELIQLVYGPFHPIYGVTFMDAFGNAPERNDDEKQSANDGASASTREGGENPDDSVPPDVNLVHALPTLVNLDGRNSNDSERNLSSDSEHDAISASSAGQENRDASHDDATQRVGNEGVTDEDLSEFYDFEPEADTNDEGNAEGAFIEFDFERFESVEAQDVDTETGNIFIAVETNMEEIMNHDPNDVPLQVFLTDGFGSQSLQRSGEFMSRANLEVARDRFLAILEARRDASRVSDGTGQILHPMRIDWSRPQPIIDLVCWRIICDLRYVLTHDDVAVYLVHGRPDLFCQFVRLLSMMQGMNHNRRKFGEHVSVERDTWTKAFTLEIEVFHLIEMIVGAFCRDCHDVTRKLESGMASGKPIEFISASASRKRACQIVRRCLDEWLQREKQLELDTVSENEKFSVSDAVSMHLPLHRLLALFGHHMVRLDKRNASTSLMHADGTSASCEDAEMMLKHPLRIQVFLAQVTAGMWRRNGRAVIGQTMLYRSVFCADSFVDLDIFMMQQCMTVMDPDEFVQRVVAAFALEEVLEKFKFVQHPASLSVGLWKQDAENCPVNAIAQQMDEFDPALLEAMISLFIHISTERARCGNSERENLRRKFVHLLCVNDLTHSQLTRICPRPLMENPDIRSVEHVMGCLSGDEPSASSASVVDNILRSISDFSRPHQMEQGRYRLKDAGWEEFDPFMPYLSLRDRSTAEDQITTLCRRQNKPPSLIPVKSAVCRPLYESYQSLLKLTWSLTDSADSVVTVVLRRCLQNGGVRALEGSLSASLYILATAVEATSVIQCGSDDSQREDIGKPHPKLFTTGDNYAGSVLDCVVEMYARSSSDPTSPFVEYRTALHRILNETYTRGGNGIKSVLHAALPGLFAHTGLCSRGAIEAKEEGQTASNSTNSDERRKRMLRMKKEKQAAAMLLMRSAQEKFAASLDSNDEYSQRESAREPKKRTDGNLNRDNDVGDLGESNTFSGAASSEMLLAERMKPSVVSGLSDESKPAADYGCSVSAERNVLQAHDHVCALCREPQSTRKVMGIIALAQTSSIPVLSSRFVLADLDAFQLMAIVPPCADVSSSGSCDDKERVKYARDPNLEEEEALSDRPVYLGRSDLRNREHSICRDDVTYRETIQSPIPGSSRCRSVRGLSDLTRLFSNEEESRSGARHEFFVSQIGLASMNSSVEKNSPMSMLPFIERGVDDYVGIHVGFCGHAVHIDCFGRYLSSLRNSHAHHDVYEGYHILNLEMGEFLCPVCRRLANLVIPLVPDYSNDLEVGASLPNQYRSYMSLADIALEGQSFLAEGSHVNLVHLQNTPSTRTLDASSVFGGDKAVDILVDAEVWSHAVDVLRDLGQAYLRGADGHVTEPEQVFNITDILIAAVVTTIASWEIASRSFEWTDCKTSISRRLTGDLIRQVRLQVRKQNNRVSCSSGAVRLLHLLVSRLGESDMMLLPQIDPFTCISVIILQWPKLLTEHDFRLIARIGLGLSWSFATRDSLDPVVFSTLYLRRIAVMQSLLFNMKPPLRPYPGDCTLTKRNSLLLDFERLLMFVGIRVAPGSIFEAGSRLQTSFYSRDLARFPYETRVSDILHIHQDFRRMRFLPRRFALVTLPTLFQDLLEMMDGIRCDTCTEVPRTPALCLVCSKLVCSERTACKGWAKEHASVCGSGVGIFLVLKTTTVRVFRGNRRTNWGSPYLDEHGEEDVELHRGKPLHLSTERYSALNSLWLSHEFDHNARVLRSTMLT